MRKVVGIPLLGYCRGGDITGNLALS